MSSDRAGTRPDFQNFRRPPEPAVGFAKSSGQGLRTWRYRPNDVRITQIIRQKSPMPTQIHLHPFQHNRGGIKVPFMASRLLLRQKPSAPFRLILLREGTQSK